MPKKKRKPAGLHFEDLQKSHGSSSLGIVSEEIRWERSIHYTDENPLAVDLRGLADFGRLGQVLFFATMAYCQDKRRATCHSVVQIFRRYMPHYLRALQDDGLLPKKPRPSDFSNAMCGGFAMWLTKKNAAEVEFSPHTSYKAYNRAKVVFDTARDLFGAEFSEDFVPPLNPLGYSSSQRVRERASGMEGDRVPPLSVKELKGIQTAVSAEVRFRIAEVENSKFENAPVGQSELLPFYVALILNTCANPSSIATLRRDCIEPNPIEKGGYLIHLDKPRAGEGKSADYTWVDNESRNQLSPLNIIRFLIRWTDPLVGKAQPEIRNRLFLTQRLLVRHGRDGSELSRGPIEDQVDCLDISGSRISRMQFSERHGLTRRLKPKVLRETGAVLAWERTRSVFQVQAVLNHSNCRTTIEYLLSKQILQLAGEEMALATRDMVDTLKNGSPIVKDAPAADVATALKLSPDLATRVAAGAYFTGLGDCRNPYDSPQPNQVKGHLCSAYWACIDCGKAIFAQEHLPLLIARQIAVREQSNLMHQDTWESKYRRVDDRLSEIISSFSEKSQREARDNVRSGPLSNARTEIISFLKTPLTA